MCRTPPQLSRVVGTGPRILLVPQVHARLIADLDRGGQVTEEPKALLNDRVFCVPGQVRVVEIGQVVVEDARLWRLAGDDVSQRLIQASRDQVPVRKSQRSCPGQHLDQRGVARHRRPEASQLLIEGKPAEPIRRSTTTHPAGPSPPVPRPRPAAFVFRSRRSAADVRRAAPPNAVRTVPFIPWCTPIFTMAPRGHDDFIGWYSRRMRGLA